VIHISDNDISLSTVVFSDEPTFHLSGTVADTI
jgi:hypothetical protein